MNKKNENNVVPLLFQLTDDSAQNSINSSSLTSTGNGTGKKKKATIARSKVTKKSKTKTTVSRKVRIKKNDVKEDNDSSTRSQNNETGTSTGSKTTDDNSSANQFVEPKPKPIANKRVTKLLQQINENDILLKVRCDNKQKHTASTSTPSGLRRRPLKLPQDVSMIENKE